MIKKFFILVLVVLIIYSGIQLVTPYYRYYVFKSDIGELVRISVNIRSDELKERAMRIAKGYNIPLEEDIIITRNLTGDRGYIIKVSWQETVNLFQTYERTFEFFIDTGS